MFKNTKKQGDWGLGIAIAHFVEKGNTVSLPLTDSQDYDLIVDIDDKLNRVQVKTTTFRRESGFYCVSLTVKGGNQSFSTIKNFSKESVDYVFIVTKTKEKYFIPSENLTNFLTLNKNYDIFKVG